MSAPGPRSAATPRSTRATIAAMTQSHAAPEPVLLRACRGEPAPYTPVWFMRQAGRSLPEYRKLREGVPMLESCRRPELVTEITMQPVRRHGVDAAILFSDIVVPLKAVGVDLDIVPGVGPVIADPVRAAAHVDAIPALHAEQVDFVAEAVKALVGELRGTPLIGFAGAPFTLASYLVEGGPSRDHARTKALSHGDPGLWAALLDRLADISLTSLGVQIKSGAWAAPLVDWRVPLDDGPRRIGPGHAVQGNLDPGLLLDEWPVVERQVRRILAEGAK